MSAWYVKHRKAAKNLYALGLGVIYFLLVITTWPDTPGFISITLAYLLVAWIISFRVDLAIAKRQDTQVKVLNDLCDPYPLLEELEFQLAYTKPGNFRQLLLTNYSAALSAIGQYDRMLEILESVNIDQYGGTQPALKAVYYANLACALIEKGSLTAAAVWLGKAEQLLTLIKKPDAKMMVQQTILGSRATIALKREEYDQVIAILENIPAASRRAAVAKAMTSAELAIAMGQPDRARSQLNYVIFNGNRLAVVEKAKTLMATLTTPTDEKSVDATKASPV